jgi:hypothetical protein
MNSCLIYLSFFFYPNKEQCIRIYNMNSCLIYLSFSFTPIKNKRLKIWQLPACRVVTKSNVKHLPLEETGSKIQKLRYLSNILGVTIFHKILFVSIKQHVLCQIKNTNNFNHKTKLKSIHIQHHISTLISYYILSYQIYF